MLWKTVRDDKCTKNEISDYFCDLLHIVYRGAIRGDIIYEYYVVTFLLWPSVIILCKSKWMMRRYNTELLKKWDECSFDTYIWHLLVLQIIYVILKVTMWGFIGTYVGMLVTVVVAFAVGRISHKYISVPIDIFIEKKIKRSKNITVCVVPSHENDSDSGIMKLGTLLAQDGRIDKVHYLRRTKKIDKLAEGGERDMNVHLESIEVDNNTEITGDVVLLMDDVTTSNNSLKACKKILLGHGAERVAMFALGQTIE